MIREVMAYQTTDGEVFAAQADAEAHEAELKFDAWYGGRELFGIYEGSIVELSEIKKWLRENRTAVLAFLRGGE